MMTGKRLIILVILVIAVATANAAQWRLDPRESRLQFVPTYEGRPTAGQFRAFSVQLDFDPAHPEQGQLRVSVNTMSADLNSADLNEAIRAPDWFDVVRYPKAEFVSSRLTGSDGRYLAEGRLTLKGTTQAVEVPFAWRASGRTATMTGRLSLDRTDFRIGTGEWADGRAIGRPVEVRFELRLERSN